MALSHNWILTASPDTTTGGQAFTTEEAWEAVFDAADHVLRAGHVAPFTATVDEQEALIVPARDSSGNPDIAESLIRLADLRYVMVRR